MIPTGCHGGGQIGESKVALSFTGTTFQKVQRESYWIGRNSLLRDQSMDLARKTCPIKNPQMRRLAVSVARDYNRAIVRELRHIRLLQEIRAGKR